MTRGGTRVAADPPSLRFAPASPWQRLLGWFLAPSPLDSAPALGQLGPVRADFHHQIADLTLVPDAGDLVARVERARTLREFWHLRAEVFRIVAVQHSQAEAERRLDALGRHFPTRSPRSAFTPL